MTSIEQLNKSCELKIIDQYLLFNREILNIYHAFNQTSFQ